LQRQLPALAAAALAGQVSAEQLRKVSDLVDHIGIDAVREADEILASVGCECGPGEVQTACDRIRAHVDPDGPDPDPDAAQRRGLSISRVGSLFNVSGRLDAEGGAVVLTALDALMRPPTAEDPRTPPQRRADAMVELARQALAGGTLPTVGGVRPQLGLLLTPEALLGLNATAPTTSTAAPGPASGPSSEQPSSEQPRSAATRERATREDVASSGPGAHASAAGAPPAGLPPPDRLECAGVPLLPELPWNSWADRLPVAVAQRIACDCEAWRVILDPATGLPLEVGRAHRIVPPWIRKALHARDRGCRWPGCDAPSAWTDVHHLIAWWFGGLTDIDNCLLLCRYHHGLVHEGRSASERWRISLDTTTGEVHVYRPDGEAYELGPSQPWRPQPQT
jgi:hypothetical protein